MLSYKKPYLLFAFCALVGFGLQGLVSNTGALTVVWPNLPFPIPYINGRTFHANIGIYWGFLGLLSGIFYFFREETERCQLLGYVNLLFWLFAGLFVSLQGLLVLRYPVSRELLEGPWLLRAGLLIPFLLLLYSLSRIYQANREPARKTGALCILTGSILLFFAYLASVLIYRYPPLAELPKFLSYHAFSEMGAGLIAIVLSCLLTADTGLMPLATVEPVMLISLLLAAGVAAAAILQYFFWQGVIKALIALGLAFSLFHVIPAAGLLYMAMRTFRGKALLQAGHRQLLALLWLAVSLFYHLFAAGFLGLFLAYPSINRYLHGTYAVSSHSHQALFGIYGALAVGLAVYILFEQVAITETNARLMAGGAVLAAGGMLVMGLMLMAAGGLSVYLAQVAAIPQPEIDRLLRPYLLGRIGGGILYSAGSLLFCGTAFWRLWQERLVFTGVNVKDKAEMRVLQQEYVRLLKRQQQMRNMLIKMTLLCRRLWPSKRQK